MNENIKWGVIGAGRMSGWFSEGLSVVPGAVKYAVASRTLEKGEKFAETYQYLKAYGSYEELVRDKDVDIVYIATPIREHYRCVKLCLEAGKNVLCEKSLTVNAREAEELICLAKEKNLFFMEGMWMKCQPVFRKVREWVQSGMLGELKAIDCHFYTAAGKGHRLYRYDLAGGALLDLGYYPISAAVALMGAEPEKVACRAVVREGVDVQDSVILDYSAGAFAHLACGLGTEKSARLYLVGAKGRICIQQEFFFQAQHAEAMDFDRNILATAEGPFLKNGYEFEAMEAQKCLLEGKKESILVPLRESLAAMRILDKCREQAGVHFDFE